MKSAKEKTQQNNTTLTFPDLITPFFNSFAAPACTYLHSPKTYKKLSFANDPLERWAREKGFCVERYDRERCTIEYSQKFSETWATLWASTVNPPLEVPLSWALTNENLIEVGTTFISLHYGIKPVIEKTPERIFHGGISVELETIPIPKQGERIAFWYRDRITSPSLPVALGDLMAHATWQNEEWRQSLLHILHDRKIRNH